MRCYDDLEMKIGTAQVTELDNCERRKSYYQVKEIEINEETVEPSEGQDAKYSENVEQLGLVRYKGPSGIRRFIERG